MKKLLSVLLSLTMILSAVSFSTAVQAVEYVAVYLNGTTIDFPTTDARPQIINDRTYVPVRKTCEALGLSIDWNSKTETMTLTRDGVVISHTMRTNIVYVNGEAVRFDTASINSNNRILMPIRMIAESIGANVQWDDPTRSVHITTTGTTGTTTNVSSAVVNSITSSATIAAKDSKITLTIAASSATDAVKLVNTSNNSTLATITQFSAGSDGTRTFTYEYTCSNTTGDDLIQTIQAVPGIGSTFNEVTSACKSVSFMVSADESKDNDDNEADDNYESDYMLSCRLTSDEVQTDDVAKIRVKTTSDVRRVRLSSDMNGKTSVTDDYDEDDDGNRTFNCELEMTKEGDWEVYVTLYVDGEYEDVYETFDVSVDDDYDKHSGSDELEILDMWMNNDFAYRGYETTLYVETSTDVDYLELLAEGQDEGEGITTHSTADKFSDHYYWEFTFDVKHTDIQEFELVAYNEDGDSVSDTFELEGRSVSKNDPAVLVIDQRTNSLIEGEEAKFNVTLTGCVTRLRVTRGTSSTVYDEEFEAKSSTDKTITISFEIPDIDSDYYFTAYDEDENFDRMKYKLTGDIEEEIRIKDVEIEDDDIDEDDDVHLTVTTSNSASRLWVEDNRGEQMSRIYKNPDEEYGNEYVWEIDFSPLDNGRQTFTIIAEDENQDNDSWDFKITVR